MGRDKVYLYHSQVGQLRPIHHAAAVHIFMSCLHRFFSGAAITVNFFPYVDGSIAQVTLDGKNVTQIDTYNISGIGSSGYACTPLPWTSDVLAEGQHTITVTELDPNPAISIGLVAMLSFVYAFLSVGLVRA